MRKLFRAIFFRIGKLYLFAIASAKFYFVSVNALLLYLQGVDKKYLPFLLQRFGAVIGESPSFNGFIIIDNATDEKMPLKNLIIGKNCFIGTEAFFDLPAKIILEDNAIISAGVKILTHQDCGARPMSEFYPRKVADVVIGQNSWIGANAIILAGVNIGNNTVVAAGSVVTQNTDPYTVVAGNPARMVKSLNQKS